MARSRFWREFLRRSGFRGPGFATLGLTLAAAAAGQEKEPTTTWVDGKTLTVEGQGFADLEAPWDRLPARAKGTVRDRVWSLSRHSAGIAVRFVTDAPEIRVRWSVGSSALAMPHMAATGVSGVDLYGRDEKGRWRWISTGQPRQQKNNEARLLRSKPVRREYLIYLPLYNSTTSLEVGVPKAHAIEPGPQRPEGRRKPIVFYGTSITHGACASRPGATHVAMVGRHFDHPVINLGFSGNGRMEKEVGTFLCELSPAVFVIDCLPNMNGKAVTERTAPLVAQLRKAHPTVPILLVEDRNYADNWVNQGRRQRNQANQKALRAVYAALQERDPNLHYLPATDLLGEDGDDTVDGSHPTDLGFARQAEGFQKVLQKLLER